MRRTICYFLSIDGFSSLLFSRTSSSIISVFQDSQNPTRSTVVSNTVIFDVASPVLDNIVMLGASFLFGAKDSMTRQGGRF
jgi:hypothetical protein